MNIEEPNKKENIDNPNDKIKMEITLKLGLFRNIGDREEALKEFGKLADVCRLDNWSIKNNDREFNLTIEGKRKFCDIFYKSIQKL